VDRVTALLIVPGERARKHARLELEIGGWTVVEAASWKQARALLETDVVDKLSLVVCDEELPDARGSDVLAHAGLRAQWAARILIASQPPENARAVSDAVISRPWQEGGLRITARKLVFAPR
jgi:hypothetical protein